MVETRRIYAGITECVVPQDSAEDLGPLRAATGATTCDEPEEIAEGREDPPGEKETGPGPGRCGVCKQKPAGARLCMGWMHREMRFCAVGWGIKPLCQPGLIYVR